MLASLTPDGPRLSAQSPIKLRMVEIVAPDGQRTSLFGYTNYGLSTAYPFSQSDLTTQLSYFKSLGINCIKIGNPFITAVYDPPGMFTNVLWYISQIRSLGMKIYLKISGSSGWVGLASNYLSVIRWWILNAYDLLVAIDLNNEINNGMNANWTSDLKGIPAASATSTTAADLQGWYAAVRQISGRVPLTSSLYINSRGMLNASDWLTLLGPLVDFYDIHAYVNDLYGASGSGGPLTAAGEFPDVDIGDMLRGRRFLVGEAGCPRDGTQSPAQATGLRAKFMTGMGALNAHKNSFGASYFCARDSVGYGVNLPWGFYGSTISGGIVDTVGPAIIQSWPARL